MLGIKRLCFLHPPTQTGQGWTYLSGMKQTKVWLDAQMDEEADRQLQEEEERSEGLFLPLSPS